VFCKKARDTLEHYVGECVKVKLWFKELGSSVKEILERLCGEDLDSCKGRILKKLGKKRKKRIREKVSES